MFVAALVVRLCLRCFRCSFFSAFFVFFNRCANVETCDEYEQFRRARTTQLVNGCALLHFLMAGGLSNFIKMRSLKKTVIEPCKIICTALDNGPSCINEPRKRLRTLLCRYRTVAASHSSVAHLVCISLPRPTHFISVG